MTSEVIRKISLRGRFRDAPIIDLHNSQPSGKIIFAEINSRNGTQRDGDQIYAVTLFPTTPALDRVSLTAGNSGNGEPPYLTAEVHEGDPYEEAKRGLEQHLYYTHPDSPKIEGLRQEAKIHEYQALRRKYLK